MHQELLLTPVQYSRIQNHATAGVQEGEGEDLNRRKRSATSQPPSCSSNCLVHLGYGRGKPQGTAGSTPTPTPGGTIPLRRVGVSAGVTTPKGYTPYPSSS